MWRGEEMTGSHHPQAVRQETVRLGFHPLVDAAIPIVALELGFADREGIDLILSREASWAAVRDKVAFGALDCAHMLAGMPIAASLGIGQINADIVAPMSLGLGGNAITVANWLYDAMGAADPVAMSGARTNSARALAKVVAERRARGDDPLTFGIVFPVSSHNYEIRCWMASAGVDPDHDVQLVVIPPVRMVESLIAGRIAGFCVGEPWNQVAVHEGLGHVVATKHDLWASSPEKVLGMRREWMEGNPELVASLLRALVDAARWCDAPDNRTSLARMLARPEYVGAPAELIHLALSGLPQLAPNGPHVSLRDYHVFHRYAATFPWLSQAEWVVSQMKRWGQVADDIDAGEIAARVFRPDVYRKVLSQTGEPVPAVDRKDEGAHANAYIIPGVGGHSITMAADLWGPGVG